MRSGDLVVQLECAELEDENWRRGSTTLGRGAICGAIARGQELARGLSIFCVHSSSLFSVRFPAAVHAASPLTSGSNAHDDELGCHRSL